MAIEAGVDEEEGAELAERLGVSVADLGLGGDDAAAAVATGAGARAEEGAGTSRDDCDLEGAGLRLA